MFICPLAIGPWCARTFPLALSCPSCRVLHVPTCWSRPLREPGAPPRYSDGPRPDDALFFSALMQQRRQSHAKRLRSRSALLVRTAAAAAAVPAVSPERCTFRPVPHPFFTRPSPPEWMSEWAALGRAATSCTGPGPECSRHPGIPTYLGIVGTFEESRPARLEAGSRCFGPDAGGSSGWDEVRRSSGHCWVSGDGMAGRLAGRLAWRERMDGEDGMVIPACMKPVPSRVVWKLVCVLQSGELPPPVICSSNEGGHAQQIVCAPQRSCLILHARHGHQSLVVHAGLVEEEDETR